MPDQAKDESAKRKAESATNEGENAELSPEELRAISGGNAVPTHLPPNLPKPVTGPIIVNHG